MTNQLLLVLMSTLRIGLVVTSAITCINPGLFNGTAWLFNKIVSQLLK